MERAATGTLARLRVATLRSVRQAVASLSGGQRQAIAVAKAVMWNSKLVILDEPTAALGVAQTQQVLELVRRLADQGLAVIMISHNLNDVFAVADRIAVLRLGQMVGAGEASQFDPQRVVELMTMGRSARQGNPSGGGVAAAQRDEPPRELAPGASPPAKGGATSRGRSAHEIKSPMASDEKVQTLGALRAHPVVEDSRRAERRSAGRPRRHHDRRHLPKSRTPNSSPPATSSTCSCRARCSC